MVPLAVPLRQHWTGSVGEFKRGLAEPCVHGCTNELKQLIDLRKTPWLGFEDAEYRDMLTHAQAPEFALVGHNEMHSVHLRDAGGAGANSSSDLQLSCLLLVFVPATVPGARTCTDIVKYSMSCFFTSDRFSSVLLVIEFMCVVGYLSNLANVGRRQWKKDEETVLLLFVQATVRLRRTVAVAWALTPRCVWPRTWRTASTPPWRSRSFETFGGAVRKEGRWVRERRKVEPEDGREQCLTFCFMSIFWRIVLECFRQFWMLTQTRLALVSCLLLN